MAKKIAFRPERFAEAKAKYPMTVRKLILAVKQNRPMPQLALGEIQGLAALGVLRLEVGGGASARIYVAEGAVPFLFATRVADLQTAGEDQRQSAVPASGVRRVNESADTDEGIPLVMQSAVAN